MLRHSAAGENSECVVFGQAVFQASHSLVPANTACYAGYPGTGTGLIFPTRLEVGFLPIIAFVSKRVVYIIMGATPSDEPHK